MNKIGGVIAMVLTVLLVVAGILFGFSGEGDGEPTPTVIPEPTETMVSTETSIPTATGVMTATTVPTVTATMTLTIVPTVAATNDGNGTIPVVPSATFTVVSPLPGE